MMARPLLLLPLGKVTVEEVAKIVGEVDYRIFIDWAIVNCRDYKFSQPDRIGGNGSPLFHIMRLLKMHPTICRQLGMERVREDVEDALSRLNEGQPWNFFGLGIDEGRLEFEWVWDTVRLPAGLPLLDVAYQRSKDIRVIPHAVSGYRAFLAFAAALASVLGTDEIALPEEAVAARLRVAPKSVSRYRALAQRAGFLQQTEAHRKGHATRFRIFSEKFVV